MCICLITTPLNDLSFMQEEAEKLPLHDSVARSVHTYRIMLDKEDKWSSYLLQRSVNRRDPFLYVPAPDSGHKLLQLLQQLGISLKVVVVELHPVSQYIQDSRRET